MNGSEKQVRIVDSHEAAESMNYFLVVPLPGHGAGADAYVASPRIDETVQEKPRVFCVVS